jgi:DNA-binding NarL/FixJ family response regulator
MDVVKPMPLLLVEDEVADCIKFKDCANRRNDIIFIGMTDSSEDAMRLLKTRLPEGVILDLQLLKGKGSGLQFLRQLKEADIAFRPAVVVTTSNQSPLVYDQIEKMGVDWIFCKKQSDYSPDFVIDTLLELRESLHTVQRNGTSVDRQSIESPEERRVRISQRIDTELDLVGVRVRLKGRVYIHDAIYLHIESDGKTVPIVEQVAIKHKVTYATITRVMQTAIDNAWDNSSTEDLKKYYTAQVSPKTGSPTASDFIYYYADKIRKTV